MLVNDKREGEIWDALGLTILKQKKYLESESSIQILYFTKFYYFTKKINFTFISTENQIIKYASLIFQGEKFQTVLMFQI